MGLLLLHFYCKSSLFNAKGKTVREITFCKLPWGEQVSTGLRVNVIRTAWEETRVADLKQLAEGDWRTTALYVSQFPPCWWNWQIHDVIFFPIKPLFLITPVLCYVCISYELYRGCCCYLIMHPVWIAINKTILLYFLQITSNFFPHCSSIAVFQLNRWAVIDIWFFSWRRRSLLERSSLDRYSSTTQEEWRSSLGSPSHWALMFLCESQGFYWLRLTGLGVSGGKCNSVHFSTFTYICVSLGLFIWVFLYDRSLSKSMEYLCIFYSTLVIHLLIINK